MKIAKKHLKRINELTNTIRAAQYMRKAFLKKVDETEDFAERTHYRIRTTEWAIQAHQAGIDLFDEYGIEFEGIKFDRAMIMIERKSLRQLHRLFESKSVAA